MKSVWLIMLVLCTIHASPAARATPTAVQLLEAAIQRLHWNGLYLPDINITISDDRVATVTGIVTSDILKAEVGQTLRLTDGVRGVINRLKVQP